jgi:hypothetical protein
MISRFQFNFQDATADQIIRHINETFGTVQEITHDFCIQSHQLTDFQKEFVAKICQNDSKIQKI